MKVAYTDGNLNTDHRFILQTDRGVTYWLNQVGSKYLVDGNPRYNYGGQYGDYFAVCEYWGNIEDRIAHTFGYNFFFYPGPPPIIIMNTRHMHWDMDEVEESPFEVSSLNDGYYPAACSAGDTLADTEVMLVSRAAGGSKHVYWNMEAQ